MTSQAIEYVWGGGGAGQKRATFKKIRQAKESKRQPYAYISEQANMSLNESVPGLERLARAVSTCANSDVAVQTPLSAISTKHGEKYGDSLINREGMYLNVFQTPTFVHGSCNICRGSKECTLGPIGGEIPMQATMHQKSTFITSVSSILSRLCQRMLAINISRSLAEATAIVDQISTDVAHDDNTQGFPRPSAICRRSSGFDLHVKRPGSPETRNAS